MQIIKVLQFNNVYIYFRLMSEVIYIYAIFRHCIIPRSEITRERNENIQGEIQMFRHKLVRLSFPVVLVQACHR